MQYLTLIFTYPTSLTARDWLPSQYSPITFPFLTFLLITYPPTYGPTSTFVSDRLPSPTPALPAYLSPYPRDWLPLHLYLRVTSEAIVFFLYFLWFRVNSRPLRRCSSVPRDGKGLVFACLWWRGGVHACLAVILVTICCVMVESGTDTPVFFMYYLLFLIICNIAKGLLLFVVLG